MTIYFIRTNNFINFCSDEFADFAFAFTDNNQVATKPNNNANTFSNFDTASNLSQTNFIQNALNPPTVKNSNADLLMGIQPTLNNETQSLSMKNLLDGGK